MLYFNTNVGATRTWPFSSAARRYPVWPRPLLYAAEVALKLQASTASTGGFFRVRFGEAESVLVGGLPWCEEFPQGLWLLLLEALLYVL